MLEGKKILLGVTGSIAAYKAAYLVRLLVQAGAEVKVVMTKGALQFVSPLTFSTLSKNPVYSDFTEDPDRGLWNNHVDLALWADLMVIAPLSANTLSKMAAAQSDGMLLATYMSTQCPVMIAPAMDRDMYLHPGTLNNISVLKSFGHILIEPAQGELASGLSGKGRMTEPEDILKEILNHFTPRLPLKGMKALVTAGPTYERLDPVRFIGNFSSGKMGFAIAKALADAGASVELISGPSHETIRHPLIHRTDVVSAEEMLAACERVHEHMNISVFAAAVSDYRPEVLAAEKIKKSGGGMRIDLIDTPDIAGTLGAGKIQGQIHVGFALETTDEEENAKKKLTRKNLDLMVLNSLKHEGAGFGTDTNKITLIWPDNKMKTFGLKPKSLVAQDIVDEIVKLIQA